MPLTTNLPSIDDRTYQDLVGEIRARIPSYTDEWTDLNESDTGMAFIELFAWLSEMLLYRLGRVPEHNYIKFLELLGIELHPAEPARAEVTLPVKDTHAQPYVLVPDRTQIESEEPDDQGPIIFETEKAFYAMRSALAAVQSRHGMNTQVLTDANAEAENGFEPFGPLANDGSQLLLGFSEPWPQVRVDLAVWAVQGEPSASYVTCGLGATTRRPSADLAWEYFSGSEWIPLSVLKDETAAFAQSGHIQFTPPAEGLMAKVKLGEVDEELFWVRARVDGGNYEKAPHLTAIRTNTVEAVQAETIRQEILGATNGAPQQIFTLANTPVLDGSLILEIDEGFEDKAWEARSDLLSSGPHDRHFVLNRTTGELVFGDGQRHGAIPVANPARASANVVAVEYRIGGGARGNLAAGKLSSMPSPITGIDTDAVGNLMAAAGGRDEQSLEDAKEQAALSLKSKCRAVTNEDFELLATQVGSVRRAKALPLYHPDFPETTVPGVVSVIVVPEGDEPNPMPSEGLMRTVCEHLDKRRLLTTEVYVLKPSYRHVEVRGTVIVKPHADLAEVKERLEQTLQDYFHPLLGGEDGRGWPFGGDVYFSKVYQRLFVDDVDRIDNLALWIDGKEQPECRDVPIDEHDLVYSTTHGQIEVVYAEDAE